MKIQISLTRLSLALSLTAVVSAFPPLGQYPKNDLTKLVHESLMVCKTSSPGMSIRFSSVGRGWHCGSVLGFPSPLLPLLKWLYIADSSMAFASSELELDIFQKIKALGYNCGTYNQTYIDAYTPYVRMIGEQIANARITKGGPVVMLQVGNELVMGVLGVEWPQKDYMQDLINKFRAAGVIIPTTNNEGGAIGDWDGAGFDSCAVLTNNDMVDIFYKNNIAMGVKVFNVYMSYGGTNWGSIAGPAVYTSYNYGSAIKETREITCEKYNELKLQAGLIMSSPAYLTSKPTDECKEWCLDGKFCSLGKLNMPRLPPLSTSSSSQGNITVPQLGSKKLSSSGRDSKIHLTDYKFKSHVILYSSAEMFTWKTFEDVTIAIFYGKQGETHEAAFKVKNGTTFTALEGQAVVSIGKNLIVYFVDKNTAYKFSAVNLIENGLLSTLSLQLLSRGPYLVRSAEIVKGSVLDLKGDLNATASIEVIAPPKVKAITWNGKVITALKTLKGTCELSWKYTDSLREVGGNYDDKAWTIADKTKTLNARQPTTPTISMQVNMAIILDLFFGEAIL
ncbi:glycoside hydrolase superfamily [Tirmania nivea]|nr:glycoside hydrolase superfamily [Tirmania nivea]